MFFLFVFSKSEDCTYSFENEVGMSTYHIDITDEDSVCMDLLYYPSFVIFQDFNEDTMFTTSSSLTCENETYTSKTTYVRYLRNYQNYPFPCHKIKFTSGSNTTLRFTVLSVLDMCKDGLYISTKQSDTLVLSTSNTDTQSLDKYTDKCFVPATTGHLDVYLNFTSDSEETLFYAYHAFTNFSVHTADLNTKFTYMGPHYFRILVGSDSNNTDIRFHFVAKMHQGYNPRTDYFFHEQISDECPDAETWATNTLALVFCILAAAFFIIDFFWFAHKCYTGAEKSKTNDENAHGSARPNDSTFRSSFLALL